MTVCGPILAYFECDDRLTCLCGWWWWWSTLTRFLHAGRKSLGFTYCEHRNRLDVVWMVDIDLISVWDIEFGLISAQGSELICFV